MSKNAIVLSKGDKISSTLKNIAKIAIVALTLGAFWYYLANHPETIDQLRNTSPLSLAALLLLYGGWIFALILVAGISLRLYGKTMSWKENSLFNVYSVLINFFGPGQSGPVFRAAYLKKRLGLRIKQFTVATLIYYGFYALISVFFMFVGTRPWWQTTLLMITVAGVSFATVRWYSRKKAHLEREPGFNIANVALLFGATLLQMIFQAIIFGVELHEANASASLGQTLSYTGVANLALFVALTPGAIGIREAFLLFSQNLHQISSGFIVAANIIDRAVYLVFLGLMFAMVLATHAKDKLHVRQIKNEAA